MYLECLYSKISHRKSSFGMLFKHMNLQSSRIFAELKNEFRKFQVFRSAERGCFHQGLFSKVSSRGFHGFVAFVVI